MKNMGEESMTFEEYLSSLKGKSVAVIGIGVSNRPLIELLLSRGIAVTACDRKEKEARVFCGCQLVVIPLMQSDTWLIKYICHTYKS